MRGLTSPGRGDAAGRLPQGRRLMTSKSGSHADTLALLDALSAVVKKGESGDASQRLDDLRRLFGGHAPSGWTRAETLSVLTVGPVVALVCCAAACMSLARLGSYVARNAVELVAV